MIDVAPHPLLHKADFNPAEVKLGKKSVLHDQRTLQLANYMDLSEIAAPPAVDYTTKVTSWPMYGNNSLGDCTCAAAGHMVQAWSAESGKNLTPADQAILDMYWKTGDHADTGRFELEILRYWRTHGLGTDKIYAYGAVPATNQAAVRAAIYLFGGVYTGVGLPKTAQGQAVWDVVGDGKTGDSQPWSWGGHAVPFNAYDQNSFVCVTWGGLMKLTNAFQVAYVDEVYAIVSHDWMDRHSHSPQGFNMAALRADLKKLGA